MSAPGDAVRIRAARRDEVEAVLAAYEWLFEPPGRPAADWPSERARAALLAAIESERSHVLVAAAGRGALVGLCTAYLDVASVRFGQRCWVEDLAVAPDRRSRGIGARLLGAARAWGRAAGATHLELDTGVERDAAQRFYEREAPAWRTLGYAWTL